MLLAHFSSYRNAQIFNLSATCPIAYILAALKKELLLVRIGESKE